MKVLSSATIHGLRALIYLVTHYKEDRPVAISELSSHLDISFHFLTKTLQQLTQRGILISHRGPQGGIMLARPANKIFLRELIEIIEGDDFFNTCMLGLPGCGERKPCPMHDAWGKIRTKIKKEFGETSLEMLARKAKTGVLRL